VFNTGILARVDGDATFDYERASGATRARASALGRACERYDVSLPAAALDFALRNSAVSTVVVGARSPGEVRDDVAWAGSTIPPALRDELDAAPDHW
jgi:D-threo-aldose 1-dehydrogenase